MDPGRTPFPRDARIPGSPFPARHRQGYPWPMARPVKALDPDPAVVPIADDSDGSIDDWLRSLMRDEPIELSVTGAELVAEARAEQE